MEIRPHLPEHSLVVAGELARGPLDAPVELFDLLMRGAKLAELALEALVLEGDGTRALGNDAVERAHQQESGQGENDPDLALDEGDLGVEVVGDLVDLGNCDDLAGNGITKRYVDFEELLLEAAQPVLMRRTGRSGERKSRLRRPT